MITSKPSQALATPARIPRFPWTDIDRAYNALTQSQESANRIRMMIANQPGDLEQTRSACLRMEADLQAHYHYGLGFPLEDVRKDLVDCAQSSLKVFELRGTEEAFPVVLVTIDVRNPGQTLESPRHPPGTKDYSLTNPKANLRGVCVAMSAGEWETAARLAALAWDPPKASYINARSQTCRLYDQHLAYAVRDLFANKYLEAGAELDRVRTRPTEVRPREVANLVRALIDNNHNAFLAAMDSLLNWHEKINANRNSYEFNGATDKFLCLWAIGFGALAVRRGLIEVADLPQDNLYVPIELIKGH